MTPPRVIEFAPRYRCHKEVQALEILNIELFEGHHLMQVGDAFASFVVSPEYVEKHNPQAGGYWVRYADGYESYSPAKAFEEGYTRIEE